MKTLLVMFMVLVGVMVTSHADGGDGGGVIPLLKRHEIQVLLAAGFPPTGVADRVAREAG